MLLRDSLLPQIFRDAEGGEGGGAPPPSPPPATPPVQTYVAPQQQAQPPQQQGGRPDTIADVRAEAAAHRIAARQHREQAEDLQRQLDALRSTIEGEKTKVVQPLTTKVERLQQRMIDATLTSKMVAAGLVDPDLVALATKMPDAPKLTLSDDDEVQGVDDLVEKFKKWKPDYFRAAGSAPPAPKGTTPAAQPKVAQPTGGGQEPPASGNTPVTDVRKMDKDAYKAWKQAELRKLVGTGFGSRAN